MSTFNTKPIDAKREEFRKYLERSGFLDVLTKVLISLYEEQNKPDDALEYFRKHIEGGNESSQLEDLRKEIEEMRLQNAELKEKLSKQTPEETAE